MYNYLYKNDIVAKRKKDSYKNVVREGLKFKRGCKDICSFR